MPLVCAISMGNPHEPESLRATALIVIERDEEHQLDPDAPQLYTWYVRQLEGELHGMIWDGGTEHGELEHIPRDGIYKLLRAVCEHVDARIQEPR